ncbi:MAG: hypothetical protein DRI34_01890 [Deltaproteobacteria bacterium]|nr:MAG: hypothetical protein DRI34_01890 [Deltaproteobacteria bacterium]
MLLVLPGPGRAGAPGALAWFKQGVELSRQGDYQAALLRYQRARSLAPNWALPYLEIAVAHLMTDNDRKLIGSALKRAVELGDDIPRAHYLYGVFLQEEGRRRPAIAELTRALQLRPSMVDARYRLALLYIEEGAQQRGLEQLELVVGQRPSHVGARRTLAVLYEQSGRLEQAEKHLAAICKLYPNNAYHLSELARFYRRVGWQGKARSTQRAADKLDPARKARSLRPLPPSRRVRRRSDPMEPGGSQS